MSVSIGGVPTTTSRHKTQEEADGMVKCWKMYFDALGKDPALFEYSVKETESEIGRE